MPFVRVLTINRRRLKTWALCPKKPTHKHHDNAVTTRGQSNGYHEKLWGDNALSDAFRFVEIAFILPMRLFYRLQHKKNLIGTWCHSTRSFILWEDDILRQGLQIWEGSRKIKRINVGQIKNCDHPIQHSRCPVTVANTKNKTQLDRNTWILSDQKCFTLGTW